MTQSAARIAALVAIVCTLPLLTACEWFDYHPYCVDISGETHINAKNISKIEELTKGRTSIRFALISDTQRWYDETEEMVADINSRDSIDFVVHAGDLTDFGANKEFLWQRDILQGLRVPYVAIIGNHDCLATGRQTFMRVWGDLNFAFTAGDVRFVCLNTNALEFDYSSPVPDMNFIAGEIDNFPDVCSRAIVAEHCRPFDDEFNNNMARYYHEVVKMLPGLMFTISGHCHSLKQDDLFGDGYMYYTTTCAEDRKYLIFNIKEDGYTYEVATF